MIASLSLALVLPCLPPALAAAPPPSDTIRLEVGSREIDGRIYAPHAALVRVRVGAPDSPLVAEWTNELTHGDSAGRPIHRWVTRGTQHASDGSTTMWELRQTYDAVTLAPYGYVRTSSAGGYTRLKLEGTRVVGVHKAPGSATEERVEVTLDRPGWFAGASDLIPLAAGLADGKVMTAPVWSPSMTRTELRTFTVRGRDTVDVEGTRVAAWKIDEHRTSDGRLLATWWMTESSPYMVYGEVVQPNGQIRRMTEVAIPMTSR